MHYIYISLFLCTPKHLYGDHLIIEIYCDCQGHHSRTSTTRLSNVYVQNYSKNTNDFADIFCLFHNHMMIPPLRVWYFLLKLYSCLQISGSCLMPDRLCFSPRHIFGGKIGLQATIFSAAQTLTAPSTNLMHPLFATLRMWRIFTKKS